MFKKIKEGMANLQDVDKALEGMNKLHMETAKQYLIGDEEIIQCYGKVLDFAALTNKRLIFVDAKADGRKKVVSIPYSQIVEVSCDYGYTKGEVEIITRKNEYELKFGNLIAERFVKDLLSHVLK